MASFDAGTGILIVVVAIIAISFVYAIVRWWRWHRY
jgi:hypothetical protein